MQTCWDASSPLDRICRPSTGRWLMMSLSNATVASTSHDGEKVVQGATWGREEAKESVRCGPSLSIGDIEAEGEAIEEDLAL